MAISLVFLLGLLGIAVAQGPTPTPSVGTSASSIPSTTLPPEPNTEEATSMEPETQAPTIPMDTCLALEEIAFSAEQKNVTCFTNLNCDGLECMLTPLGDDTSFPAKALIFPCLDPPGVQLTMQDPGGRALFDKIISQSTNIEIFGITVIATLDQLPAENAIGFQVELHNPVLQSNGGPLNVIFPYTKIPIDKSACPTTTCGALRSIEVTGNVANNVTCMTNEACDGLECQVDIFGTGVKFPAKATVLPCNKPPAVNIVLREPGEEGRVIVEQMVSKNATIKVLTFEIGVRLDQLENAIGLRVDGVVSQTDFESTAGSQNGAERIIQYTRIPINATGCPDQPVMIDEATSPLTSGLLLASALLLSFL